MSACKKKKLSKVLLMQLQLLVECLEKNPALVSRSSCKCDKNSKDQMHWEEVAAILNAYPKGVKKSPSQWRKYWNKKIIAVRRNVTEQKTQNAKKNLNPFEARVWKIIAEADKISQDHNMPASPAKTIKLEPHIDNTQSPNKTTKSGEDFRFTIQIKPKEPISQSCSTAEDIQHSTGVLWELKQEKMDVPQSPPASTEQISQICFTAEDIQHPTGIWEIKQEKIDVPQSPPASTEQISQLCSTDEYIQHSTGIWEIKQEKIDVPQSPPASTEQISQLCSTAEDIQHSTGIWEIKQEEIDVPQSPSAATEPIYSQSCSSAEDIQQSTGMWELKQDEIDIPLAPPASDETGAAFLKITQMKSYKTCAVPMCKSTTVKCPDKLFIYVPKCRIRRKQWLQLARRNFDYTSDKSAICFCEDHFDLPNDMENYIKYRVMGYVGKIRMKPGCLPSKFQCQPDRIKRTSPPQPRSAASKRQRMDIIQEILAKETEMPATSGMHDKQ